jgi:hypothetical protein
MGDCMLLLYGILCLLPPYRKVMGQTESFCCCYFCAYGSFIRCNHRPARTPARRAVQSLASFMGQLLPNDRQKVRFTYELARLAVVHET